MRRRLIGLTAAVALAIPATAQGREFVYRGQFAGEPQSSVIFDATGNKKGTKIRKVEHLSAWDWPGECSGTPFNDGFFFVFGPDAVDNKRFRFDVPDFLVKGKFKRHGRKAVGTLDFDDGLGCATDGPLDWTAKRRK